jgi:hypothetical protein
MNVPHAHSRMHRITSCPFPIIPSPRHGPLAFRGTCLATTRPSPVATHTVCPGKDTRVHTSHSPFVTSLSPSLPPLPHPHPPSLLGRSPAATAAAELIRQPPTLTLAAEPPRLCGFGTTSPVTINGLKWVCHGGQDDFPPQTTVPRVVFPSPPHCVHDHLRKP